MQENHVLTASVIIQSAKKQREKQVSENGTKMTVIAFIALCNLFLAIPALVIGYAHMHDACIGKITGISFDYPQWLTIYGWVEVSASILALCVILLTFCIGIEVYLQMFMCVNALYIAFHLAWYVVGAILLFNEITPTCAPGDPLYDFGIALFVLKSIALCCSVQASHRLKE